MSDELKTFIVTQTEQFRVRAASAWEAKQAVAEAIGDEPHVEWLSCVDLSAEEVSADGPATG